MKWTRSLVRLRSAFTLLEVVVAGLLLSTILAGSYSMMMGNMGTVRTLSESSHSHRCPQYRGGHTQPEV